MGPHILPTLPLGLGNPGLMGSKELGLAVQLLHSWALGTVLEAINTTPVVVTGWNT